jgi:hypothetical protein
LALDGAIAVAGRHAEMPPADVAAMFITLAQFCNQVYPDRLDYLDRVFAVCGQVSPFEVVVISQPSSFYECKWENLWALSGLKDPLPEPLIAILIQARC